MERVQWIILRRGEQAPWMRISVEISAARAIVATPLAGRAVEEEEEEEA